MLKFIKLAAMGASGAHLVPHMLLLLGSDRRTVIYQDLDRWSEVIRGARPNGTGLPGGGLFVRLMTFNPEYRNLFYSRVGIIGLPCLVLVEGFEPGTLSVPAV